MGRKSRADLISELKTAGAKGSLSKMNRAKLMEMHKRFTAHVLYSIHKNSNAVPRLHVSENSVSETGVSVWGLIDAPCTRCAHREFAG